MKLRNLALSSASVLVLTVAAALAEGNDPYTHNSTPQEQAQTSDLNATQEGRAVSNVDADAAAQQQYQDQQLQYQQQQQQYQTDTQRYQAQQDRYRSEQAEYFDRTHPYAWWHEHYAHATLNHFYDIPRAELVDLRVVREDGYTVGRIREIDRHGDGRVAQVRIELHDGDSAWVKARDLRYDPEDRIVFTDLSAVELHDLARNS